MEHYLVITFESTHLAMAAERQLAELSIDVIPTPRQISASCGISIKTAVENLQAIQSLMGADYGKMNQCYEVKKEDGIFSFKKL